MPGRVQGPAPGGWTGSRMSAARCAYCHDALVLSTTTCPGCGTFLHPECVEALGGRCPTLGCARRLDPWSTCGAPDRPLSPLARAVLWLATRTL